MSSSSIVVSTGRGMLIEDITVQVGSRLPGEEEMGAGGKAGTQYKGWAVTRTSPGSLLEMGLQTQPNLVLQRALRA